MKNKIHSWRSTKSQNNHSMAFDPFPYAPQVVFWKPHPRYSIPGRSSQEDLSSLSSLSQFEATVSTWERKEGCHLSWSPPSVAEGLLPEGMAEVIRSTFSNPALTCKTEALSRYIRPRIMGPDCPVPTFFQGEISTMGGKAETSRGCHHPRCSPPGKVGVTSGKQVPAPSSDAGVLGLFPE